MYTSGTPLMVCRYFRASTQPQVSGNGLTAWEQRTFICSRQIEKVCVGFWNAMRWMWRWLNAAKFPQPTERGVKTFSVTKSRYNFKITSKNFGHELNFDKILILLGKQRSWTGCETFRRQSSENMLRRSPREFQAC